MGVIMKKLLFLSIFGLFVVMNGATVETAARQLLQPGVGHVGTAAPSPEPKQQQPVDLHAEFDIAGYYDEDGLTVKFDITSEDAHNAGLATNLADRIKKQITHRPGWTQRTLASMAGTAGWLCDVTLCRTARLGLWGVKTAYNYALVPTVKGVAGATSWTCGKISRHITTKRVFITLAVLAGIIACLEALHRNNKLPEANIYASARDLEAHAAYLQGLLDQAYQLKDALMTGCSDTIAAANDAISALWTKVSSINPAMAKSYVQSVWDAITNPQFRLSKEAMDAVNAAKTAKLHASSAIPAYRTNPLLNVNTNPLDQECLTTTTAKQDVINLCKAIAAQTSGITSSWKNSFATTCASYGINVFA